MSQQGSDHQLARFEGRWALGRVIADDLCGRQMRYDGLMAAVREGEGLRIEETGRLVMPGRQPLAASRIYLWRVESGRVAVRFADGRPFHIFDPADATPSVRHLCGADLYAGRYDFTGWPCWSLIWRVYGPRKAWTSRTTFVPETPTGLSDAGVCVRNRYDSEAGGSE
jgi:hypothetical protein